MAEINFSSPSGSAGTLSVQSVQTANFTALKNNTYPIDTTAGSVQVTLPASPSVGDTIGFYDYANTWSLNNVTFLRNGSTIYKATSDYTAYHRGEEVILKYDATNGWLPIIGRYADAISLFNKTYTPWVRNAEWPALPTLTSANEQVSMLVAIYPDVHYLAFKVSGNYQIDWGDGSVIQYNAGVQADHAYSYSSISSTVTTMGYKIVTVTITPQAGQHITSFNSQVKNATAGLSAYGTNILDMVVALPYVVAAASTNLIIGATTIIVYHNMLESVNIVTCATTDASFMFMNCYALQYYAFTSSAIVTTFLRFCANTYSLRYAYYVDTSKATSVQEMFFVSGILGGDRLDCSLAITVTYLFGSCKNMLIVPQDRFPVATSIDQLVGTSSSLTYLPNIYAPLATSVVNAFTNMISLEYFPKFSFPLVISANPFCSGNTALKELPAFNMPNLVNIASFAQNCTSLAASYFVLPTAATSLASVYSGCATLTVVPSINCLNVTTSASTFSGCTYLKAITLTNTSKVNSWNSFALSCTSLQSIDGLDLSSATDVTSMFQACNQNIRFTNYVPPPDVNNISAAGTTGRQMAVSSDGLSAYVCFAGSNIIQLLVRNSATDQFRYATTYAVGTTPFTVFITPDQTGVYVTNSAGATVTMFSRASNGSLINLGTIASGTTPTGITGSNNFIYAVNAASASISIYSRNTSTSVLTTSATFTVIATPQYATISPDGAYLFLTHSTGISSYLINQGTGALTLINTIAQSACYNLVVTPDGKNLYACPTGFTGLYAASINTATGVIALLSPFSYTTTSASAGFCVITSPDGNFIYQPGWGSNFIYCWSRNSTTGALTQMTPVSNLNASAYGGFVTPDGNYLYYSTQNGTKIGCGSRDVSTGILKTNSINSASSTFVTSMALVNTPVMNISGSTSSAMFGTNTSMQKVNIKGLNVTASLSGLKLQTADLNTFISNTLRPITPPVALTLSTNPGYFTTNLTGVTWTRVSKSVVCASTTGLAVGQCVWTAAFFTLSSITLAASTNIVGITAHGRENGSKIAFTNLTGVVGISAYVPYYVVNATTDTLQLAYTPGGAPIQFSTGGTSTAAIFQSSILSVDSLTQFTVDSYPANTGAATTLSVVSTNNVLAQQNGFNVN